MILAQMIKLNLFKRIGFQLLYILIISMGMFLVFYIKNIHVDYVFYIVVLSIFTLFFIRTLFWCKYYIYKIEINNSILEINYYKWNKKIVNKLNLSEINIIIDGVLVVGVKKKIIFKKDSKIICYQIADNKWDNDKIIEIYEKLIDLQKSYSLPTTL